MAVAVLRRLWAPRSRWLVLSGLWVAVAVLGMWGMVGKSPPGSTFNTWDRLYAVPDLFGLTFANDYAAVDWRIQLARFLGPMVTATTFLQASALLFREQVDRLRLRLARDHVVVCGLGEKGLRLAASFRDGGRRVAAVEVDPASPGIPVARAHGVAVLVGDATDPIVLRQAGVARAGELVAAADDGTNARVAALVRELDRRAGAVPLHCAAHLLDPQLCHLLRSEALEDEAEGVRLEFFNVHQQAARAWLAAEPVLDLDGRAPHLVVVGVGLLGQSLVVAAGQRWADRDGAGRLPVTLVDREAGGRLQALRLRHPSLERWCEVTAIDLDLDRPAPDAVDAFTDLLTSGRVTAVFVALDADATALSAALTVRQVLGSRPAKVLVRTRSEAGLGVLLGVGRSAVPVVAFSPLDRTCTAEAVAGGTHEQVARALHDDYLARVRRDGGAGAGSAAVPWEELPEPMRESNRRAAAALAAGLHEVELDLIPLYRWDDGGQVLTDAEVEVLARREHDRWAEERRLAGWRWGERRDDAARTNPLLVPWEEMAEADRERDRQAVRELPAMLARAGFDIVRSG
jgi:TrkA-N domain/RyR domain